MSSSSGRKSIFAPSRSPVDASPVDPTGAVGADNRASVSRLSFTEGNRRVSFASSLTNGRVAVTEAALKEGIEERRRSHFVLKGELADTYNEYRDNKEIEKSGVVNRLQLRNSSRQNANNLITSINATKNIVSNIITSSVRDVVGLASITTSTRSSISSSSQDSTQANKTPLKASIKRDLKPIRYGDCLLLSSLVQTHAGPVDQARASESKSEVLRGLLSVDTIVMVRAFLLTFSDHSEIESIDESIFQICKPAMASASARTSETELQEETTAIGSILTYDSPFLLKVITFGNCYLSIEPGRSADIEKNCVRIGPNFNPTAASQFKMVPKYRSRVKDAVYYGDELCINAYGSNLFLHAADTLSSYNTPEAAAFGCKIHTEVSASRIREAESGSFLWECSQFSNFDTNSSSLFVGQFIRLYHPELRGYLSSHASKLSIFAFKDEIPEDSKGKSVPLLINDVAVFSFNDRNHGTGQHDFAEDLMASSVFRIEKSHVLIGGNIQYNEVVRFRHIVTGSYLSVSRDQIKDKNRPMSPPFTTTLSRLVDPTDSTAAKLFYAESSFVLEPVGATDGGNMQLGDSYVRIKHLPYLDLKATSAELYGWINPHQPSYMAEYSAQAALLQQKVEAELKSIEVQAHSRSGNHDEFVLTFTDDVIRDIPMYPSVVDLKADTSLDGPTFAEANSASSARRTRTLEIAFSRTHRGAAFVADANDADVIQIVPVGKRVDSKYILGGQALSRVLHDFEGALRVCVQRKMLGENYNISYDTLQSTAAAFERINVFCNISSDFEQTAQKFNESLFRSKRSLDTEHDSIVRLVRHQLLVMECGILEKLFCILRAPVYLRLKRSFVKQNKVLAKLFRTVSSLISAICKNNEIVQEYIARSSFRGLRLGPQMAKTDSVGFLSHLFTDLRTDEESASRVLQAAVSSNRLLLDALFDEAVMQGVIQLIREKGPKPSLLKLLASMANAQGQAMTHNQQLLMKLLYGQTDDQRYLINRRVLLIETTIEKHSDNASFFTKNADVYLLWFGEDKSKTTSSSLFCDLKSLDLRSGSKSDSDVIISDDLKNYLREAETDESDHEWVKLESIAWYIDPPNCFKFYEKGVTSSIAWRSERQALRQSPERVVKYNKIRELVQYYAAVLDFYDKVTANRSYISPPCLEPQITHRVLFSGMSQSRLPLFFRHKYGRIFKNMYVDRYPHDDLDLPNVVRTAHAVDEAFSRDSALPVFFCRSRPNFNPDGTISFSSVKKKFLENGLKTKFEDVQEMIATWFLMSTNVDIQGLSSYRLGDIAIAPPSSRLGGSELDSFRFSLVLLEIMHQLLKSGFYYSQDLLLQIMHIAFGVLRSHTFNERAVVDAISTNNSVLEATIPGQTSDVPTGSKHHNNSIDLKNNSVIEMTPTHAGEALSPSEDTEESEVIAQRLRIHHVAKDLIVRGPVARAGAKVIGNLMWKTARNRSTQAEKSFRNLDPTKSDDLIRICRRHDIAFHSKNPDNNEVAVVVEIMEHQRYVGAWLPEVTGYRHAFSTKDEYLIQHSLNLASPADNPSNQRGLPDDTWYWTGDWTVNPSAGGGVVSEDPEGWVYSMYWPKDKKDFSPRKMPYHIVRRRLWQRTRQIKSAELFVDGLLAKNYSENAILLALRRNIDSSGLIDMKKVLSGIRSVATHLIEKNLEIQDEGEGDDDADDDDGIVMDQETIISSGQIRSMFTELSQSCLVESLGMLAYVYDIITDARITIFSRILQSAIELNEPIWRSVSIESPHSNKSFLTLTSDGETKLRSLFFETSMGASVESGDGNHHRASGSMYCVDGFYLGGEAFLDTVLGFVLSNNHRICDKALDVLRKHFGQMQTFSRSVSELVYSNDRETSRKFLIARHLISRAKYYVSNVKSMHGCIGSVLELDGIYNEMIGLIMDPTTNKIDSCAQNMLRAMRAFSPALFVISNDISSFKNLSPDVVTATRNVRKTLYTFMQVFLCKNTRNALLLANDMDRFVEALGLNPEIGTMSAKVICYFLDSGKAVLDTFSPYRLYQQCIAQINKYPKEFDFCSACLMVLQKTLTGDSAFLSINQTDALCVLLKYKHVLQLYVGSSFSSRHRSISVSDSGIADYIADSASDTNFQERRDILLRYVTARSRGAEEIQNAAYAASLLQYHADCVETLALTCWGKNVSNAIKCSRIIPLEVVLVVLCDPLSYEFLPIVTAFTIFLNLVYFSLESSWTSGRLEFDRKTSEQHPLITKVIGVFQKMVEALDCAPEDQNLRVFIMRSMLPLFKSLIRANEDIADDYEVNSGSASSILLQITSMLSHLRTLSGFSSQENDQINELLLMLGIPTDESVDIGTDNPVNSSSSNTSTRIPQSPPPKRNSLTKKNEIGHTKWGSSEIRFSELKDVFHSCPKIKDMQDAEMKRLVDYLLESYMGMNEKQLFSSRSNFGGSSELSPSSSEDNQSESVEPLQTPGQMRSSEFESPKSPRSGTEENVAQSMKVDLFQNIVARLVKFAREEVDVVISTQNLDIRMSESARNDAKEFSRSRSDALDMDAFFFSSDDERGSNIDDLRSNRLITGECSLSKNVEFVMRILTQCVATVRKTHATNRLRFGEENDIVEKNTLFEDVQNLFSQVMATSLIVEVISGCKFACVVFAALNLGVELFANGNAKCQSNLVWHLKQIPASEAGSFFKSMHGTILYAASRFRSLQENRLNEWSSSAAETQESSNRRVIEAQVETKWILQETGIDILLEFLQLLNEGHFHDIQMLMQSQESIYAGESGAAMGGPESAASSTESYPLLTAAVNLLEAFIPNSYAVGLLSNLDADVVLKLFDFLTESVQGPCYTNQEVLARSPVLVLIQNLLGFTLRVNPDSRGKSDTIGKFGLDFWKLKSLRIAGLRLLMSLTEGRQPHRSDAVYEALCTVDFSVVPEKLDSVLQERSIALHRLLRRGASKEEMQTAEGAVMEEGFLFLAVSKTIAQVKPSVYGDILPIVPSSVKRKLFTNDADFQHAEKQRANAMKLVRSFYVFDDRLRSVEILWGDKGLFRFQFIMPLECSFLSEELKEDIIGGLDFGDDDRMKALVQKVHYIHDDISLKKSIDGNDFLRLLIKFQDELDYAITGLAVFINFLLVISLQQGFYTGHDVPQFEPPEFKTVVRILTVIQVILLLYKLLQTLILRLPIIFKDNYRFTEKLRILKKNSKSLTFRMKMKSLIKIFGKTLAVFAVSIILNAFIYQRYSFIPAGVYGICILTITGLFLKGLERMYRSVWTAHFSGSWLVLSAASILRDGSLRFRILFAVFGILSLDLSRPFFNSLMPLTVIRLSNTLQNVVKAVTLPGQALILSAVLGFMMIFVFAIFAFFRFPTDFYNADQGENECGTLLLCLVTFLHGGLLSGGGIADRTSSLGHEPLIADPKTYGSRVTYDLFFFVIITVLLLNIIFGIIIDTFGKLREDASEKRRLQRDFCFVCGISRDAFEAASHDHAVGSDGGGDGNDSNNGATKGSDGNGSGSGSGNGGRGVQGAAGGVRLDVSKGSGFAEHIKNEHNLWDYVFFLIYLKLKDENNYFGIESYVADLMQRDDVSWVPRGKALRVPDTRDEDQLESESRILESIGQLMSSHQSSTERSVSTQIQLIQTENSLLRQQLGSTELSVVRLQESLAALRIQQKELEDLINLKMASK